MKHGKKPTYSQRKFLESLRLNPADWLVVKDTPQEMVLVHRYSKRTTKTIYKSVLYYDAP